MFIKTTHLKCLKSYYRDSHVEVTYLFLECSVLNTYSSESLTDKQPDQRPTIFRLEILTKQNPN